MPKTTPNRPIIELRVALTAVEYEKLIEFYRDGLDFKTSQKWAGSQGQAEVLEMGSATLEIFDETQAESVDLIEAGKRISGKIRFALQVPDLDEAMQRLLAHGAILVHPPVVTPWGDKNVRLQDPEGMQITLFQKQASV